MKWVGEELINWTTLNDLAGVHNNSAITDF